MNRPLLIVLTPVRNEAWILKAFLKAASLWADYIIIADQMSTDGSREIYKQFDKVIVVDNTNPEMHQAHARKLLFEEASKIQGDKILFALDADEFLSGNFDKTQEWHDILNSKSGDCFCLCWHNIMPDRKHFVIPIREPYYWVYHVKNDINGEFPDNYIHEWRLPWPDAKNYHESYDCKDLSFLHFGVTNEKRQYNKECFYQVSTLLKEPEKSAISLHRMYNRNNKKHQVYELQESDFSYYKECGLDVIREIDFSDFGSYYVDVVLEQFEKKGINFFAKLDIWDSEFVKEKNLRDPRSFVMKSLHRYLRCTQKHSDTYVVRIIDKVLKRII